MKFTSIVAIKTSRMETAVLREEPVTDCIGVPWKETMKLTPMVASFVVYRIWYFLGESAQPSLMVGLDALHTL